MTQRVQEISGWLVIVSECGQYVYVSRDGSPGEIHVKAEDEGFVVDIWADDDAPEVVATTSALYTELEKE